MNTQPEHTDVAAYVLGLLDDEEMQRFEQHLLTCARCSAEADELMTLPPLLQPLVSPPGAAAEPPATAAPSPSLLPTLLSDVAADRARRRRRRFIAFAAAAVLIVAGPAVGIVIGHQVSHSTTDSVAAHLMIVGEQHQASDPATGLTARVGLEQRTWGTHVAIKLTGLHGPLTCDLVAYSKTGQTQTVASWIVPAPGYGIPGHPDPLVLHGAAAMTKTQIDHLAVRTLDGRTLITIPV